MKKPIPETEYSNIIELYNSGLSKEKIQNIYNVSNTAIDTVFKKSGIKFRDNSHKSRLYNIDENYFSEIDTKNKAYVLGLLFSDGCNYTPQNRIKISLQKRDGDILFKIRDEIKSTHPIILEELSKNNPNHQDVYTFQLSNKKMSQDLYRLGMVDNKSLILDYPASLPDCLFLDFLRGLIDGDGHIENKQRTWVNLASTQMMCSKIQDILNARFNIESKIYNTCNKESPTKLLTVTGKNNVIKLLDLIYKDAELYIQRKFDLYTNISLSA